VSPSRDATTREFRATPCNIFRLSSKMGNILDLTPMTKTANHKVKSSSKARIGVGGVIATATAITTLVAGAFLMTGKRGEKNRNLMRGWAVQAKGEVLQELEQIKEVTQDKYLEIVDSVLKRYKISKKASEKELSKLSKELRAYWSEISAGTKTAVSKNPAKKTTAKKSSKSK